MAIRGTEVLFGLERNWSRVNEIIGVEIRFIWVEIRKKNQVMESKASTFNKGQ